MSLTYNFANEILNYNFGLTPYTPSSTLYMGLSTVQLQPDGTGVNEPIDPAYIRIPIPNNKVTFSAASDGSLTNIIEFQFPESQTSWGTITHFFLADSQVGGNIKIYGNLTNSRVVELGTVLILEPNALQINLQNCTL